MLVTTSAFAGTSLSLRTSVKVPSLTPRRRRSGLSCLFSYCQAVPRLSTTGSGPNSESMVVAPCAVAGTTSRLAAAAAALAVAGLSRVRAAAASPAVPPPSRLPPPSRFPPPNPPRPPPPSRMRAWKRSRSSGDICAMRSSMRLRRLSRASCSDRSRHVRRRVRRIPHRPDVRRRHRPEPGRRRPAPAVRRCRRQRRAGRDPARPRRWPAAAAGRRGRLGGRRGTAACRRGAAPEPPAGWLGAPPDCRRPGRRRRRAVRRRGRAPPRPRSSSGGTGWFSTWNISVVGRKRVAAFGMRSTLFLRAISMATLAVMPGFSFSSGLGTEMTVE